MKKSLVIIAAAALVFTGCTDNDILKNDINESNSANNGAIAFNAFTEKVTRAENSDALYTQTFYNHQESFQVWARKSNQPKQEIFDGVKVNVGKSGVNTYTYTYAPERFWDKLAPKYHFYAAAPARATSDDWYWTFNGKGITTDATLDKGYFSIDKNFTLNEVNLKHTDNGGADDDLEKVFKGVQVSSTNTNKDIDLLIAAPAKVTQTYYNIANPNAVNLNFIHILSKLNVTIKTSLGTVTSTDGSGDHTYDVKLLAFEIKNIPNVGKFSENPNNLSTDNKQIRWRLIAPASNNTNILTGIKGLNDQNQITASAVSVPYSLSGAQKKYIVESLFIPQEIKYQRIAMDGIAHDIIDSNDAVPYDSYQAYQEAKNNNGTLNETQFDALINNGAFVTWANYTQIEGESDNRISETTFNSRVAQTTKTTEQGTAPYSNYTEFATAKAPLSDAQFNALFDGDDFIDWDHYSQIDDVDIDEDTFNDRIALATNEGGTPYSNYTEFITAKAPLSLAQFNALFKNGAFVDWDEYDHTSVPGETDNRVDRAEYNKRVAEATETTGTLAPAYPEPSEPYFTIKYSIDNEIFTASYNLAAAFKNMDNNQFESDGVTDKDVKFAFYAGWQNTLNIIINPTAIQFTADVAEWATNADVDYTIENGNGN